MPDNNYTIRTMNRQEIGSAIDWAANEGWNPGPYDADCFHAADPTGFLTGLLDGEPIAAISAVKYGASFGFIGCYIVKPEFRGRGYGIKIWDAGLQSLAGRNIGLDGVVAQQDNYKKSGFKLAYRNVRYQGIAGSHVIVHPGIVDLASLPFESVDQYDSRFFPETRTAFIRCWINQPQCHALGVLRNGRLQGYGVIRVCRVGYKIGPLFADDAVTAETLFLALRSKVNPDASVYLDVPEVNREAVAMAERFNMTLSFETARMYSAKTPAIPLHRVFGVTSFELG